MTDKEQKAAAYVPWRTFTNQLDRFHSQGLPNQIDPTLFQSLAGGTRNELIAALRFLGLVEGVAPTKELAALVAKDGVARKADLRRILQDRYAPLFALDLTKVTPKQFEDALAENFGMQGSTLKKGVRFFLAAAKELDIPISKFLSTAKRSKVGNGSQPKPQRKKSSRKKARPLEEPVHRSASSGSSKEIELEESDARITFSVSKDLLSLAPADRSFVIELVEKLESYEKKTASSKEVEDA